LIKIFKINFYISKLKFQYEFFHRLRLEAFNFVKRHSRLSLSELWFP
jgi:predicted transcriptional regulator